MASTTSTRDRVLLEEGVIKAFSNCNGTTRMKRPPLSDCNLLINSILPGHPDATARMKRLSTKFLRHVIFTAMKRRARRTVEHDSRTRECDACNSVALIPQ